jgi:SH3-like domain-containing protein
MTQWSPTHQTPENGMRAWGAPDPSQPPVTRLGANEGVRVLERRGAWAHVQTASGWTGWVDDRLLTAQDQFVPTHQAPPNGMQIWAEPDPAIAPEGMLAGDTKVAVTKILGAWARVTAADGRTGWVDARLLHAVTEEPAPVAAPVAAQTAVLTSQPQPAAVIVTEPAPVEEPTFGFRTTKLLTMIGGLAVVLSAFVPWIRFEGTDNAFDLPIACLWSYTNTGEGMNLAVLLLVLGVLGLVAAFVRLPAWLTRTAGGIAIVAGLAFILQFLLFLDNSQVYAVGDVLELIGFAPLLTIGGGVLMLSGY